MAVAYLVDSANRDSVIKVPKGASIVIGRTGDSDYILDDAAASRRHLEISNRDDGYYWRDLDSTNGVFINEEKLSEGKLKSGDRIRIGSTVLLFEVETDERKIPLPTDDSVGFRSRILDTLGKSGEVGERGEADVLLEAIHAVMNDIASNYEPCSLVDRILETTMKAIDAQRGAIFFADPDSDALLPCPVCNHVHVIEEGKLRHAGSEDIHISRTVARRVLKNGESVLVQDTGSADGLDAAASILSLNLRSIICAPIRGKYGVLGILYIDSDRPEHAYTHGHMLLSTAVGNSAGLALENAKMHQEILLKERIERDIELAGIIQDGFLEHRWPTDDSRYQVYAEMQPAKIVGGDFYDFVKLDADRVGVLVGDVSGKGVPSALAMAQILAEFRVHATQETSPAAVLGALNKSMCERSQRGMFCTLCYLSLDLKTGEALCANAGHSPLLHVNAIGTEEAGPPSGPPIGIMPEAAWEDILLSVDAGDAIFMYTDGITEARAESTRHDIEDEPDEYGLDSLRTLARDLSGETPEIIVREVLKDVHRFCEPFAPHDDCTLLVLRRLG